MGRREVASVWTRTRGLTAQLVAAGTPLRELLPMDCTEFGTFLNGPQLDLALTLMGNVALNSWLFPHFSEFEWGRCRCKRSHIELRRVQLPTQRKVMQP